MTKRAPKTWLITGVSSGFGRAIAEAALDSGDHVYGTVRREEDARDFNHTSPRAHALHLDMRDLDGLDPVVQSVEETSGGIDILVNNAGYGLVAGVEEASLAEVRDQFEVNVFAPLAVMQAVLPFMRARARGHIINISSVSGLVGWPGLGIYTASKFALEGLSETLALELKPLGIKLTLIEPGGLRTAFSGQSRRYAARRLDDYHQTVGANRNTMRAHAGQEGGDPRKAAAAVIHIAGLDHPPARLLLGADAIGYTTDKLAAQFAEIDHWKSTSLAIAFDEEHQQRS